MKKLTFALAAAAAVLSFGAFGTAAQAQGTGPGLRAQVYVTPAPHPGYGPRQDRRYHAPPPPRHFRHSDRRWQDRNGAARRDRDGDGVPNRYDRAPNNPYRR